MVPLQVDADSADAFGRPIFTRTVDGAAGKQAQPQLSVVQGANRLPAVRLVFGQQQRDLEIDQYRSSVRSFDFNRS